MLIVSYLSLVSSLSLFVVYEIPKEVLNYLDRPIPNMSANALQVHLRTIASALDTDVETILQLEHDQRLMCFVSFIKVS